MNQRLKRFLVNAFTVISVLVLVAATTCWITSHPWPISYWTRQRVVSHTPHDGRYFEFSMQAGKLSLWHTRLVVTEPRPGGSKSPVFDYSGEVKFAGIEAGRKDIHDDTHHFTEIGVTLPFWMIVVVAMVIPGIRAIGVVRRRLHPPQGLCPICGYDLRAHQGGQKCPECGTMIAVPLFSDNYNPRRQPAPTG